MTVLNVSVDLDEYLGEEQTVDDYIKEQVGLEIRTQFTHKVSQEVNKKIEQSVEKMCVEEADKILRDFVDDGLKAVLKKTNSWGEELGKTFTFREYFTEILDKHLNKTVNNKSNNRGGGSTSSNLEFLIQQGVTEDLKKAIDDQTSKITAEAKKQVQASVSGYIAQQLTPSINVPSLEGK